MEDSNNASIDQEFLSLLNSLGIEGDKKKAFMLLPKEQRLSMISAQKRTATTSPAIILEKLVCARKPLNTGTYTIVDIDYFAEVLNTLKFSLTTLKEDGMEELARGKIVEEVWSAITMLAPATWPKGAKTYISTQDKQNRPIFKILDPCIKFFRTLAKSPAVIKYIKANGPVFNSIFEVFPSQYSQITEVALEIALKCAAEHMLLVLNHFMSTNQKTEHISCVPMCTVRIKHILDEVYYNISLGNASSEMVSGLLELLSVFYREAPLVGIMVDSTLRMCGVTRFLGKIKQKHPDLRPLVDGLAREQEICRGLATKLDVRKIDTTKEGPETKEDLDSIINAVSVLYRINSSRLYDVLQYIRGTVLEEAAYKNKDAKKIEQEKTIRIEKTKDIPKPCVCGGIKKAADMPLSSLPSPVLSPERAAISCLPVGQSFGEISAPASPGLSPGQPQSAVGGFTLPDSSKEQADFPSPGLVAVTCDVPEEEPATIAPPPPTSTSMPMPVSVPKTPQATPRSEPMHMPPPPLPIPKTPQAAPMHMPPPPMPMTTRSAPMHMPPPPMPMAIPKTPQAAPMRMPPPPMPMTTRSAPMRMPPPPMPGAPPMPKKAGLPGSSGKVLSLSTAKITAVPIMAPPAPAPVSAAAGPRARYIAVAAKLHPAHPQQLSLDLHIRKPLGVGLWSKLDKSELSLFKKEDFAPFTRSASKAVPSSAGSSLSEVSLISANRCKAIDIVLSRNRIPLSDLVASIDRICTESVTETLITGLIANYPTDDELDLIRHGEAKQKPEIFYKHASKVYCFKDKLIAIQTALFALSIDTVLIPKIQRVSEIITHLTQSKDVQTILTLTRSIVNVINAGGRNEGAWGIRVGAYPVIIGTNKKILQLVSKKVQELKINLAPIMPMLQEAKTISTDQIEMDCEDYRSKRAVIEQIEMTKKQKDNIQPTYNTLDRLQSVYLQYKDNLRSAKDFFNEKESKEPVINTVASFVIEVCTAK
ncbi:hypothetical protein NEDG_01624 [Nematocida displodere]|uniref:FH2 domain-containing protein n=1 Tax=Nematocida displodere TaxID=1805483 RepID=A0A177EIB2_9MICR|nr:hypothetical protein NEDG_01624 [Nematocida displodere]